MNTGAEMREAVTGLRLVHVAKGITASEVREVREGTTGRVLTVPRIWAVAAPSRRGVRAGQDEVQQPKVELAFYRKYTEAMLRRYLKTSMEAGRVPSLLGREMFRGQVTSYKVKSFEDAVIFCVDVERCLGRLRRDEQQLIQRIGLQRYTQGEAALLLGMSLRRCIQRYGETVDRLTEMFLSVGLLEPLKSCQEGKVV
jgi:hypothetical protein